MSNRGEGVGFGFEFGLGFGFGTELVCVEGSVGPGYETWKTMCVGLEK